jgi:hypothetical protein
MQPVEEAKPLGGDQQIGRMSIELLFRGLEARGTRDVVAGRHERLHQSRDCERLLIDDEN